jgi:hypothetical protein
MIGGILTVLFVIHIMIGGLSAFHYDKRFMTDLDLLLYMAGWPYYVIFKGFWRKNSDE